VLAARRVPALPVALLAHLSPTLVGFLTRTSILERMCGPLCDAVLDTEGSGQILTELEDSNLLLVPLDRRRDWYRYHQLFRELLLTELKRREPELVGRPVAAERWADAAERSVTAPDAGAGAQTPPDGSTIASYLAMLRGLLTREGVDRLQADAHLTLAEIGQRLYVSKHTVKTQVISIYRKLGASSRSQAVQRLQEIGLLGA
jgi:ATP/maltotriose-dependent transcriptional regulator MalT